MPLPPATLFGAPQSKAVHRSIPSSGTGKPSTSFPSELGADVERKPVPMANQWPGGRGLTKAEQTVKRAEQDLMQNQSETPRPVVNMVATAYGVQHSLQLEQKLEVLQRQVHGGARGMPSAWRRASEVERKLNAARETSAAARVQVAMLRGESKRKGQRIAQLQALIDDLEKDNRALRARLSAEGQDSIEKPLPGFAASAVDTCLNAAVRASERLLAAGLGDIRRPGAGTMPRRRDLNGGVFFAGNDAGGEVEDEEGARGAASHAPPLVGTPPVAVWSAELWVRSLQLEELVVQALLRYVHSATSLVPAELPFLCGLGAHTNAHSVVLALLREGTLLERLADRLALGAVKMHYERSRLFSPSPFSASSSTLTSVAMALRSVHPLRLHRLAHTLSDLAPAPATHDLATLEALFTPAPTDEVALHAVREEHTAGADAKLRFTADDLAEPTFALAEYSTRAGLVTTDPSAAELKDQRIDGISVVAGFVVSVPLVLLTGELWLGYLCWIIGPNVHLLLRLGGSGKH